MLSCHHANLCHFCSQATPSRTLSYLAGLSKTPAPGPNSTFPANTLLPKAFDLSQVRTPSFHQHWPSSFLHSRVGYRRLVQREACLQGSMVLQGSEVGMLIVTQCTCYRKATGSVLWEETKEAGLPGRPRLHVKCAFLTYKKAHDEGHIPSGPQRRKVVGMSGRNGEPGNGLPF